MTEPATSPLAATLTRRVAEARVEDLGRAIARPDATGLARVGARPGAGRPAKAGRYRWERWPPMTPVASVRSGSVRL